MKIIHNQTNINGFPLALAGVKLTPHIDWRLNNKGPTWSVLSTRSNSLTINGDGASYCYCYDLAEITQSTPGEATEVYPSKNLNIRTLNELQTERAAPNIRPVVGKVIRETIFEDQILILISRTSKDSEEWRMRYRKVERQAGLKIRGFCEIKCF